MTFDEREVYNGLPLILSADSGHAMGIYSPDFTGESGSMSLHSPYDYGTIRPAIWPADCCAWGIDIACPAIAAGNYAFQYYVIVGYLDNVKGAMMALHNSIYPTLLESTYKVNGVLLNTILKARTSAPIANTGYKVNGVDLAQYYERLSSGSAPAVTGYKVNGADLNTLFCAK
jgi:hypothetical protein